LEIVERLCTHVGIIVGAKLVEQTAISDLGSGGSLEQRFLEVVGTDLEKEAHLSWLGEAETAHPGDSSNPGEEGA